MMADLEAIDAGGEHEHHHDPAGAAPPVNPDELSWNISYDRASVDRFLADVEGQRTRLQAEIEAVKRDVAAQRTRANSRVVAVQRELGARVLTTQLELAELETAHHEVMAAIRTAAETEAARVLAAARREVEAMRTATASLVGATPSAPHGELDERPSPEPVGEGNRGVC